MAIQELVVGGGCFWCIEAMMVDLSGVVSVESGYAGGPKPNPTYKEVCSGMTGHAEVIKVSFDPEIISRSDLLRIFFVAHDPTTLNRQGTDLGTQYRSVIFYSSPDEEQEAITIKREMQEHFDRPIVTTIEPLLNYTTAESYHQGYYDRFENGSVMDQAQMNAGYCSAVIAPKVNKFRATFREKLRRPAEHK